MRILIIGNSKSAEILGDFFSKNPDLLVFTTKEGECGNFININSKDANELKDFALANEINLTIVADQFLSDIDYLSIFGENNLAILYPDFEALKIASSKAFCKKFIYKNKIKTPKFALFEKSNLALDYIKNADYPLVIKPDMHFETQTAYIAETFGAAKREIEKLFQSDNRKILIEEYIYGKELAFYAISDGFRPVLIDGIQNYQNEFSIKGLNDDNLKEKIYSEIIFPVISALAEEGMEYIGILGFDIIVTPNGEIYLIECNPFFKDIDAQMILEGTDVNWQKLFMDAIVGTLADNFTTPFSINSRDEFFGSFRLFEDNKEEIITQNARTLNLLYERLLAEGLDKNILDEAKKIWKQ